MAGNQLPAAVLLDDVHGNHRVELLDRAVHTSSAWIILGTVPLRQRWKALDDRRVRNLIEVDAAVERFASPVGAIFSRPGAACHLSPSRSEALGEAPMFGIHLARRTRCRFAHRLQVG